MEIEIKSIQKNYGKKQVLRDVSFSASGGSCTGIIGANGCGKSTLFSIFAGIQTGKGEFLADGTDLLRRQALRQRLVGYVPQGTPLIEELSARDNLLLWYDKRAMEASLQEGILSRLGVGEFLRVPVRKLSGGMKKRLSIACALSHAPEIIIMDEPTAALDIVCRQIIAEYIALCRSEGKTVILSTHEATELSLCDQLYLMKDGVLHPYFYEGNAAALAAAL